MLELVGIALALLGIFFAFDAPRNKFLSMLGKQAGTPSSASTRADALTHHDQNLVLKFRGLFADSGLYRLYQGHDFLLPLKKEATAPLYEVVETWTDEAHLFSHPELRTKQLEFINSANELATEIVRYTVPDGNGNISVITRQMDPENLAPHVRAEAKAIDAKLPAFLQSHEELLAICNRLS